MVVGHPDPREYFTRASLRTLLGRHGYEVIDIASQPKAFAVRYYLSRIEGYSVPARALGAAPSASGWRAGYGPRTSATACW